MVSARDEFIENRIRVLPQGERVLHFFLTLNLGLLIALLAPTLLGWASRPAGLMPVSYGWLSWTLSALALVAAAWSVRDLRACRRLRRARP